MRPSAIPARRAPARSGWLRAAAVIALCTALSEMLAPHFDLANIIMVYLAGVAYIAMREEQRISVTAVVAAIFLFDLIYVPPRWGLNPLNPKHFFTFAVMLAVGLLIGHLARAARQQTELAEGRARRAQALSELAQRLAAARTREAVAACVAEAVQSSFGGAVAYAGPGSPLPALPGEDLELLAAFDHQARLALDRCQLEERSARAQVQAEAERLRNTLLAGISHDFRTPLTTIIGAATTLSEQDARLTPPARVELARGISEEAARLHALVSDLLDLTRLEEGAMAVRPEWCPADDLVAETLQALGSRAATHDLRVDVPADAVVWCDARLVERALLNLAENALRHTPAGTAIAIAIRVEDDAWKLRVSDRGGGLPPGSEQDIFRRFQRGGSDGADGGTGLGLAICAAVARAHHGTISAENREGGASFEMALPQPSLPPAQGGPA